MRTGKPVGEEVRRCLLTESVWFACENASRPSRGGWWREWAGLCGDDGSIRQVLDLAIMLKEEVGR